MTDELRSKLLDSVRAGLESLEELNRLKLAYDAAFAEAVRCFTIVAALEAEAGIVQPIEVTRILMEIGVTLPSTKGDTVQ